MKKNRSQLSKMLEALAVPKGSVAIAWLGQAGFALKSPRGCRLAIDPYLSNSCEAIGRTAGLNMRRQVRAPLAPRDLIEFDVLAFTHSHQDHVDPDTIGP